MINKVLKDLPFAIAYLNDTIIYSKTAEEHFDHVHHVFHKLCDAELSMKLSKYHSFAREIQYLGHVPASTGIKPLPSQTAAIKLIKLPKNAKQVRAFHDLVGYYCKIVKNFAHIAKPLTALTCHDVKLAWTSGNHAAFNTLKSILIETPIHHYPDPSKCYIVYTDASDDACGAQLNTGTQWPRTASCISLPHIHRHPIEMKHYWTGSLWHLLCCNKVELLSKGIWHGCTQWPKTPTEVSEW